MTTASRRNADRGAYEGGSMHPQKLMAILCSILLSLSTSSGPAGSWLWNIVEQMWIRHVRSEWEVFSASSPLQRRLNTFWLSPSPSSIEASHDTLVYSCDPDLGVFVGVDVAQQAVAVVCPPAVWIQTETSSDPQIMAALWEVKCASIARIEPVVMGRNELRNSVHGPPVLSFPSPIIQVLREAHLCAVLLHLDQVLPHGCE